MTHQNDIETDVIDKALDKAAEKCPYRNDPDSFDRKFDVCYNKRVLKVILGFGAVTLGVAGGVLAAWVSLQSEIAIVKERQNGYQQVLSELKEIRIEITDLKVKIAQSNNRGTP